MVLTNTCLSFMAKSVGGDLKLTARLNGQVFFEQILTDKEIQIKTEFPDVDDEKYLLEIEMSGKLEDHTIIDENNNIMQDRLVEIKEFTLDDLDLQRLFEDTTVYRHSFNGTQEPVLDKFFGSMGCNGVLNFEFTSPVYLWILKNM